MRIIIKNKKPDHNSYFKMELMKRNLFLPVELSKFQVIEMSGLEGKSSVDQQPFSDILL